MPRKNKKTENIVDKPLVPDTPTIDIDYDKYGHCAMCHKRLIKTAMTSDGPVEMFTSDHGEREFLLSDGSRMRVTMCKKCQKEFTETDADKLMTSIYKGWYIETQYIKKWDDDKRRDYLYGYLQKEIVCESGSLPNDVLETKLKKYRENKILQRIGKKTNGPSH